jgi:hypothetical protein
VSVGGRRVDVDLTSSVDDLVVDLQAARETRPLTVRFELPDGTAPADGSCELTCYEDGYAQVTLRDVPVRSGVARVDVRVPSQVRLLHVQVPGLWPDLSRAVRVETGTEAAELVCEGLPAGGIFGHVLLPEGEPARDYSINVLAVQMPDGLPAQGNLGNSSDWEGLQGRFNVAPLPLGGTYVVVLTRPSYTRLLSEPIALTPESPFHELDLQFPEGVTVHGQVLLPDGSPMRDAPVTLRYRNAEYADRTNYQAGATDANGLFRLDGVNPEAGAYTI